MTKVIISYNSIISKLAKQELLNFDPNAVLETDISKECSLYGLNIKFEDLSKILKQNSPIFIRHIFPVLKTTDLTLTNEDIELIRVSATKLANLLNIKKSFSVQANFLGNFSYKPIEVSSLISTEIVKKTSCILNFRNPEQVISILCSRKEKKCYTGVSLVEDNLSTWGGGILKYKKSENQISRSELKLLEALDTFNIDVSNFKNALDLGGAPGGWSRVLSEKGLKVTTIDPGALKPELIHNPNIKHLKITTQQHLRTNRESFDLIVCDMKMDAIKASGLILDYSSYLKTNGLIIMTLKLPKSSSLINSILKEALSILKQKYFVRGVKRLFYNRSELTLILGKKN